MERLRFICNPGVDELLASIFCKGASLDLYTGVISVIRT